MVALDEPKSTTFDSGEPYLGLILSNRRVWEVNQRMSSWILFVLLSFFRDETDCTFLPTSGCIPQFIDLFRFCRQYPPGALTLTSYAIATDGSGSGSGPGVPCSTHPYVRCAALSQPVSSPQDSTTYFSSPFTSPSDKEPSAETYNPATELVGDPDEPYVADHVPYGAPDAYYLDASYGSERESASTDTTPSSHHSSSSSSGSVSLGYGSASSGSASDGASDVDLVNRYFAGTFPPP
ncbi:hypothetical protein PIB30_025199 [Stylosanthes scabra]|uniref:Uncharacterized protein n=1 Tax=Stylosanthes scabra TaxID=79078 RepID=A0ABU6Q9G4_9FABA|nr:hypothetical protein [Stylosanthes scabra]